MNLQNLISNRMNHDFYLFSNKKGELSSDDVRVEYSKIKTFLFNRKLSLVAIKMAKDYDYMLVILACLELGITYIPLGDSYPENRIKQIEDCTNFDLLITDEIYSSRVLTIKPTEQSIQNISEAHPAYIIFTSGSTGMPKGVVIKRESLHNFIDWLAEELNYLDSENRMLEVTEFTFDISLIDLGLFLTKNIRLYFSEFAGNVFKLAFELEKYGIDTLSTVPNNMIMLLNDRFEDRVNLTLLNNILVSGARFPWGLYQKMIVKFNGKNIYNGYGPTESTIFSHMKKIGFNEFSDSVDHTISIGATVKNVEAIIGDKSELLLSGIQLMDSYINNEDKTKESIVMINDKSYYRSGDIAFQDDKGEYYITGRLDDTIKYRGFRINLLDIDSYITKLSYVDHCCTVAIPHEQFENTTHCFVISTKDITSKLIKEDLKKHLLEYQIPTKFYFVDDFPVNNSGKICKKELQKIINGDN